MGEGRILEVFYSFVRLHVEWISQHRLSSVMAVCSLGFVL